MQNKPTKVKGTRFNTLQMRLANVLLTRPAGMYTDELARRFNTDPSTIAWELKQLKEDAHVTNIREPEGRYVRWFATPSLRSALQKYIDTQVWPPLSAPTQEPEAEEPYYAKFCVEHDCPGQGSSKVHFYKEAHARETAARIAEAHPGVTVRIYGMTPLAQYCKAEDKIIPATVEKGELVVTNLTK